MIAVIKKIIVHKGGRISFAGQFRTATNGEPFNISALANIEFRVQENGKKGVVPTLADVQVINAALGTFTAVIMDSTQMAAADYDAQINYADAAAGERFSDLVERAFEIKRTLKYGA